MTEPKEKPDNALKPEVSKGSLKPDTSVSRMRNEAAARQNKILEAWAEKEKDRIDTEPGEFSEWLSCKEAGTLPVAFIEHEMENDVRDGYLIRELIIFVPFMILFLFFSLFLINVTESHFAVHALQDVTTGKFFPTVKSQTSALWSDLQANASVMMSPDKIFSDIANAGDWGDWVDSVVEWMWCSASNDTSLPNNQTGGIPTPYRGQLYSLGAMRIRTQRVRNDSCSIAPGVLSTLPARQQLANTECFNDHKKHFEESVSPRCSFKNPFKNESIYQYLRCVDLGELPPTTTAEGWYDCGGYIIDIPFSASCDEVRALYSLLVDESCPFVDNIATRFVVVEFFSYAPQLDTFFSTKLVQEVSGGGGWITSVQVRAFLMFTSNLKGQTVLDFIFFAFVLYYLFLFFYNLRVFYIEEGVILRYFLNSWTLLEAVNVVIYLVVFILRWSWWGESARVSRSFPFADAYPDLDNSLWYFSMMRYVVAINFLLTFLKVLKYLRISQKLGVITRTFEKSQTDVIGLLFVFVLILTGYAVSGNSLWGPNMKEFSTLERSFSTLLFMLVGQMDYDGLKLINPTLAGFYFWSYLVLAFFLALNFIVAVIGNAFSAAGEEEWTPSLSEALELTVYNILSTFSIKNIKRTAKLFRDKKISVLHLRGQILGYVKQNNTFLKLKFPRAMDIPVTPADVLLWLPPAVRSDYMPFIQQDWIDLRAVFELQSHSEQEVLEKERTEVIQEGVAAALRGTDEVLSSFEPTMISVEEKARAIIERILPARRQSNPSPAFSPPKP